MNLRHRGNRQRLAKNTQVQQAQATNGDPTAGYKMPPNWPQLSLAVIGYHREPISGNVENWRTSRHLSICSKTRMNPSVESYSLLRLSTMGRKRDKPICHIRSEYKSSHSGSIFSKPIPRQPTFQLPGNRDRPIRLVTDIISESSTKIWQRPTSTISLARTNKEQDARTQFAMPQISSSCFTRC